MSIQIKLMPSSPETDLEQIKGEVKKIVETQGGKGIHFHEEPIAFGLKAIILTCIWPEAKELENLEESLRNIENVSSEELIDIRRAM